MVGQILAAKLMRAGIWAVSHGDPNLALELMGPVSREGVALAISDSGTTPETVRLLRAARAAGAATIALTSRDPSPLTQHADTVLLIAPISQPPTGGFVTSIAAQIFAIQALVEQLAIGEGAA
jgi:DNA-binding MurR/RpiR family transcriptional regulator